MDAASAAWSRRVYQASSPTSRDFAAIAQRIERMWDTQPHLTGTRLETIRVPVRIVDGDRNIIRRSDTDFMARSIPLGSELILPFASHYALWEYPSFFNAAVLQFFVSTAGQHAGTRRGDAPRWRGLLACAIVESSAQFSPRSRNRNALSRPRDTSRESPVGLRRRAPRCDRARGATMPHRVPARATASSRYR